MNYLGHAFVASLQSSDPAFALGAMLPDLTQMAGLRLTRVSARLIDGIAFHHRTDSAFHAHPSFVDGQRALQRALSDAGVRKGPARAMAHIGIEFLIDAAFVPSDGYLEALELGAADSDIWGPCEPEIRSVLRGLCGHLRARLWAPHQVTEVRLIERLRATLDRRPRLAPTPAEVAQGSLTLAKQAERWKLAGPDIASAILLQLRAEARGE